MSESLTERLQSGTVLIGDGAMGSELYRQGLPLDSVPETWLLDHPERVEQVHRSYVESGSDWITTNTFGGNPFRLLESNLETQTSVLNRVAADCARRAAGDSVFVLGTLGPSGLYVPPHGNTEPSDVVRAYTLQVQALDEGGVDGFLVETMLDVEEARCIVAAARSCSDLPILVSLCFRKKKTAYETLFGLTPPEAAEAVAAMDVQAVGANCMLGAADYPAIVEGLRQGCDLPVLAQPNAGQPEQQGETLVYPESPSEYLAPLKDIHRKGARLFGGCCGTTPETIRALRQWARSLT